MKGFLLLLVFSAAGLAGVLYWRHSLLAPRANTVASAGAPAKEGKDRRRRRRRGARRLTRSEVLARNDIFVGSSSPGEAPPGESPSPAYVPPPPEKERAPLAPGGSATTEAAPSEVFGALSPSPAASNDRRQPIIDEPEPIKLRPADLKIVWQGEDLSRPETQRLDFSNDSEGHELSQDEIDKRFRTKEDAVLGCISRARPDEYTFIPGRVTVRFRIQRTGVVKGAQVEAPVILHKGGLTGCVKGVLASLRFPASSTSQVVTFPFSLM